MTDTKPFNIDYTQYALYERCPWAWYERYVNGTSRDYGTSRRSDSLALGTLVHAGLERFDSSGIPEIPQSVIADINPTPTTLHLAMSIVAQYATNISRRWTIQRMEEVITRPLIHNINLVAKVDRYFYLSDVTEISDGMDGTLWLQPGLWIEEHKTTSQRRHIFSQRWLMDMQADFQMLALAHHTGQTPVGVLINAIEKPSIRDPIRTCQECKTTQTMYLYIPTPDGQYRCPRCGHVQKLAPVTPKPAVIRFYRVLAIRTPERLESSLQAITDRAVAMARYATQPMTRMRPNLTNCVPPSSYYTCEYLPPHSCGLQAIEFPGFIKTDPYSYLTDTQSDDT